MDIQFWVTILLLSSFIGSNKAIICWVCQNAKSNEECLKNGNAMECNPSQDACEIDVRLGSFGMLIFKSCKQFESCDNNHNQNPRFDWHNSQCNSYLPENPSSICRCCCQSDLCSKDQLSCGPRQASPVSTTNRIPETTIAATTSTPEIFCHPPLSPQNGDVTCHNDDRITNARYKLGAVCEYFCNKGFSLDGSRITTCQLLDHSSSPSFLPQPPQCKRTRKRLKCNKLGSLTNGRASCSNSYSVYSTCSFQCNNGYQLHPRNNQRTTCRSDQQWSSAMPCCLRSCPSFAFLDIAILLDSSSSIDKENWAMMINFTIDLVK